MEVKSILLLIGLLGISLSSYMVYNLVDQHYSQLKPESIFRFKFLFCIHIFLGISILLLMKINRLYNEILFIFFIFLFTFITLFISEAIVHHRYYKQNRLTDDNDGLILQTKEELPLQITYTDVYYLIYMYSIMGITLTGMFIIVSEGMILLQNRQANNLFQEIFQNLQYNVCMEGDQCAICLAEFVKDSKFIKIKKCGHIFHDDCIREWIKYNKICPLDRRDLTR